MPHEDVPERPGVPHETAPKNPDPAGIDEFLRRFREQYGTATKQEKGRILDEFVSRTGYHRKHAARLLRGGDVSPRQPFYDKSVQDALVGVWEAAGRPGSRRLKTLLPELVPSLVRQGRLPTDIVLRGKLLAASAATIDRLLAPARTLDRVALIERQLDNLAMKARDFEQISLRDDLTPEERQRLKAQALRIMESLRAQGHDPSGGDS